LKVPLLSLQIRRDPDISLFQITCQLSLRGRESWIREEPSVMIDLITCDRIDIFRSKRVKFPHYFSSGRAKVIFGHCSTTPLEVSRCLQTSKRSCGVASCFDLFMSIQNNLKSRTFPFLLVKIGITKDWLFEKRYSKLNNSRRMTICREMDVQ
jgi:hypothetical protein